MVSHYLQMIESAVIHEVRAQLLSLDSNRTGTLPWPQIHTTLQASGVTLDTENLAVITQFFAEVAGVRYQELLRNLHASLSDGVRTWRVYKPAYTFESRNLRESEGNTMVRKTLLTPVPPAEPKAPSLISQLQSDKVDYLSLTLARENFKRLDAEGVGVLTPQAFESCFRARNISPTSLKSLTAQSLNASGQVDLSKFTQIIEQYKFAPVKGSISPHRKQSEDHHIRLTPVFPGPNKRLSEVMETLSAKLKAKYKSAAAAFRAFSHGQMIDINKFENGVDNLGMDLSDTDLQELFVYISQGTNEIPFEMFNAVFEASRPQPLSRHIVPRMALTPERFPSVRKSGVLPSDRSPAFAYGLHSKKSDNMSKLLKNDFAKISPRRKLRRRLGASERS